MRWGSQSFQGRSTQPGSRRKRLGQDSPGTFRRDTKDMCFETGWVGTNPGDKGCGPCLQGSCILFRRAGRENLDSKLACHRCCKFRRRTPRFYRRYNCTLLTGVRRQVRNLFGLSLQFLPGGHELQELAPAGEFKPSGHSSQEAICVSSALE